MVQLSAELANHFKMNQRRKRQCLRPREEAGKTVMQVDNSKPDCGLTKVCLSDLIRQDTERTSIRNQQDTITTTTTTTTASTRIPYCQRPLVVSIVSDSQTTATNSDTTRRANKRTRRKLISPLVRLVTKQPTMACRILLILLQLLPVLIALISQNATCQQAKQYFEVQPEAQQLAPSGQDVRLRCLVRNLQGECHWMRNGRTIGVIAKKYQFSRQPSDGDCSLWIRNVSVLSDDGSWQCQVTATEPDQETLESREMSLIVLLPPEKPQIKNTVQTANPNVNKLVFEENKPRTVVCEIRGGNPAPQIDWLLDGKPLSKEKLEGLSSALVLPGGGVSGGQRSSLVNTTSGSGALRVTQSKLKLTDIRRSMNGKNLTCAGLHPTTNQTTSVELEIQYVPSVSVVQREFSIVDGSPLSISCQVDANPPPSLVSWRLANESANANKLASSPLRAGPILEFERVNREWNQNVYECLAQNSLGLSEPVDVKLNVLYPPVPIRTSNPEPVQLGSSTELACLFEGNPEPEIKWLYTDPLAKTAQAVNMVPPPVESSKQPVAAATAATSGQPPAAKQQHLPIKNVTYRNEGEYHCEARNLINGLPYSVRSGNIVLDVYGEPQFLIKSPVRANAIRGERSELSVKFCSDPVPNKVFWQFGSMRLEVRLDNLQGAAVAASLVSPPRSNSASAGSRWAQRFQVPALIPLQKRASSFSKEPTCYESQLIILDTELTDERDYTLTVQNERGFQSAVLKLQVSSPLSLINMILIVAFFIIVGIFSIAAGLLFIYSKGRHGGASSASLSTGSTSAASSPSTEPHHHGRNNNNNARSKLNHQHQHTNGGQDGGDLSATTIDMNQQQQQQQLYANGNDGQFTGQTKGMVTGPAMGLANGAGNPAIAQVGANCLSSDEERSSLSPHQIKHVASMGASSDTSGDQKQLLSQLIEVRRNSSTSSGHSSPSDYPPSHLLHEQEHQFHSQQQQQQQHGKLGIYSQRNSAGSILSRSSGSRSSYQTDHRQQQQENPIDTAGSRDARDGDMVDVEVNLDENLNATRRNYDDDGDDGDEIMLDDAEQIANNDRRAYSGQSDNDEDEDLSQTGSVISAARQRRLASQHQQAPLGVDESGALIYANIDFNSTQKQRQLDGSGSQRSYAQQCQSANSEPVVGDSQSQIFSPISSPNGEQGNKNHANNMMTADRVHSSVSATIAMMNNLAAAAAASNTPGPQANSGVGALSHQMANNRLLIRKPGPPKPPKPSIQQRSRVYEQHQKQQQLISSMANSNGLVIISGNPQHQQAAAAKSGYGSKRVVEQPTVEQLAAEYSRLSFSARAEL